MHSFFLTITSFLLIITGVAYIIVSSKSKDVDEGIQLAFSWALVAFGLMFVVAINATCTFEKTVPRAVYVVLFLAVLYNAVVDQFMDGKVLGLSRSTKSKLVGGVLLFLVVYALHRTSVWMKCNVRLQMVRDQYSEIMKRFENAEEEEEDELEEEEDELGETVDEGEEGELGEEQGELDTRRLSHEDKVEIAEEIIKNLNVGDRAIARMSRQRSKEASRRSKKLAEQEEAQDEQREYSRSRRGVV